MDKEHVKGVADDVKGKAKEAVGHVFGDKKLEQEGRLDQAKGAAHKVAGDVKDVGRDAIDSVKRAPSKG
jgi:uncharacterized protein YjbJ (UPF0337 family)